MLLSTSTLGCRRMSFLFRSGNFATSCQQEIFTKHLTSLFSIIIVLTSLPYKLHIIVYSVWHWQHSADTQPLHPLCSMNKRSQMNRKNHSTLFNHSFLGMKYFFYKIDERFVHTLSLKFLLSCSVRKYFKTRRRQTFEYWISQNNFSSSQSGLVVWFCYSRVHWSSGNDEETTKTLTQTRVSR